jgi:hypothetical protein
MRGLVVLLGGSGGSYASERVANKGWLVLCCKNKRVQSCFLKMHEKVGLIDINRLWYGKRYLSNIISKMSYSRTQYKQHESHYNQNKSIKERKCKRINNICSNMVSITTCQACGKLP